MATENEASNSNILVALQVQLGEIKGILNTIVTEHARRISDLDAGTRQLRLDLDAVKGEAKKAVDGLNDKLMDMAIKGQEDGAKHLSVINEGITTNRNNISQVKEDVTELKGRSDASWGKIVGLLALLASGASVLWQALGK